MTKFSTVSSYWRRNLRWIVGLLLVWAVLTVLPVFPGLWGVLGLTGSVWPFWLASCGAPLAYLVIVGVYARRMRRADAEARGPGAVEAKAR